MHFNRENRDNLLSLCFSFRIFFKVILSESVFLWVYKVVEFQNKAIPGDLKTSLLDYVAPRDFWYCTSPSYLQLSHKCLELKHSIVKDKTIDLEMQTAQYK